MSRGGWNSLVQGVNLGYSLRDAMQERDLRDQMGEAAKSGAVEDSGVQSADEYTRAAGGLNPEQFESPEQYAAAKQAYTDAAGKFKGQYTVGDKSFANQADADQALRGLRLNKMAEVYSQNGKPEDAMRLQGMAQESELRGLQIKGAKRKDKDEEYMSKVNDFIRASGDMSDEDFYSGAAKLATDGKQDGLGFVYHQDPQTGQFMGAQYDRNTRKVAGYEPLSREATIQRLAKYSGLEGFEKARLEEKGDKRYDKEFGLKERNVAVEERKAASMEQHYKDWARLYGQHFANEAARAGAATSPKPMAVKVPVQLQNGKTVMETVLVEKGKDGSWVNSFTGDKVDPRTFKLNAGEDGPPAMEQVEEKTIGPDGRETTVKYNRPQGAKSGGYQPEKAPEPPRTATLGGSERGFTPSNAKVDITKPATGPRYVQNPITGETMLQEDLDRLIGENQTLVGRGLRFLGVR